MNKENGGGGSGAINKALPFVLTSAAVFFFAFYLGFVAAGTNPDYAWKMVQETLEGFSFLRDANDLLVLFFIFFNNSFKALVAILLGPLFFVPVIFMFANGFILGMVLKVVGEEVGITTIAAALLPHGIFEIPAVIIASGYGIWLGFMIIKKFATNNHEIKVSGLYEYVLRKFVLVIVPILIIAALIEVFVSPHVIRSLR